MVDKRNEILLNTYNDLLNDERAYNVCLSKHVVDGVLVPYYVSFCFWYDLHLVNCKLYLNNDLKTYKLISGNTEVFKRIDFKKLFDKLSKCKFDLGNSKAMFNLKANCDDSLGGLYILNKK